MCIIIPVWLIFHIIPCHTLQIPLGRNEVKNEEMIEILKHLHRYFHVLVEAVHVYFRSGLQEINSLLQEHGKLLTHV